VDTLLISEKIAKEFHETYEKLAPEHDYKTRKKSAVPWEKVPDQNKALMIAVIQNLQRRGVISAGSKIKRRVPVRK
jgi:hypothetical protein